MSSGGISHSSRVLVLNADYSALTICSIYKAFLLIYTHKAELVSQGDGPLRSVSKAYPMPSIIRLNKYINMPFRGGVVLNRHNIFKRDGHSCQYCGNTRNLTLDHVWPRSRGGKTSWENLVTACKGCNNRKGDLTPDEANMPLNMRPYKPSFVMFLRDLSGRVSEDWLTYLGQRKAS